MSKKDIMLIARELSSAEKKSADEISSTTRIPKWKVSRILKRLEKLGFVESSKEIKFSTGRPRKLHSTTKEGMKFFSEMGIKIFELSESKQTEPNSKNEA